MTDADPFKLLGTYRTPASGSGPSWRASSGTAG